MTHVHVIAQVARQKSTPKQRKGAKAQQGEDSSGHAGAYGTIGELPAIAMVTVHCT
jgi:hypothetical protein